jgi:HPt (histidine-containing phosphotransfer) domain-containing protein
MKISARSKLNNTLADLRAKLLAELPAQIEVVSVLSQSISDADARAVPLLLGDLVRTAHSIAGRAAMFDLPTVMAAAVELEKLAASIARKTGQRHDSLMDSRELSGIVSRLELACNAVRKSESTLGAD